MRRISLVKVAALTSEVKGMRSLQRSLEYDVKLLESLAKSKAAQVAARIKSTPTALTSDIRRQGREIREGLKRARRNTRAVAERVKVLEQRLTQAKYSRKS